MNKQRLELTWIGKDKRPRLEPRILLEDKNLSYQAPSTATNSETDVNRAFNDNLLIHGDNLLALKALEQQYAGKVKCIFIDPPYNTGSAFTHYDDGVEHSLWLSLMRDRLEIIRRLMSDDGSLFIMRRFDLQVDGSKLGFEDFAVLGDASYDKAGNYKYKGNYEGISNLIGAYCSNNNAHQQRQKYFEYLALSCMVRNGDAHLKNFGLLYTNPADLTSVKLAPLFDVVTTSAYDFDDQRTGRVLSDRTLALKLNKSNTYPSRKELIAFGRDYCFVAKPDIVIDRIAQAMSEVMKENRSLFPAEFGNRMAKEWADAMAALQERRK